MYVLAGDTDPRSRKWGKSPWTAWDLRNIDFANE